MKNQRLYQINQNDSTFNTMTQRINNLSKRIQNLVQNNMSNGRPQNTHNRTNHTLEPTSFNSNSHKSFNSSQDSDLLQLLFSKLDPTEQYEIEPRFRYVNVPVPKIRRIDQNEFEEQMLYFLGKVCKKVFSVGFGMLKSGQLQQKKVKVYCSENVLRNIINFCQVYPLSSKNFQKIDKCLQKQLLPYFCFKYPQTEEQQVSKKFSGMLIEKDTIADNENDLIFKSGIQFKLEENGNYNSQIMRFLNYVISLPKKIYENKEKAPEQNEQKLTYFQHFHKEMESLFKKVYSEDSKIKMLKFDPKHPQLEQKIDKLVRPNSEIKSQKMLQQYEQKVKSYTSYLIGQKLSENFQEFSQNEIKQGNLKLKNSAIMRVVTKWCEQLLKYFKEESQILNRQNPFRMKNGGQKYLSKFQMRLLNQFLQIEYQEIKEKLDQLQKNNYQNSSYFLNQRVNKNLRVMSEDQALVGQYTASIFKINENYLINYLNWLMHGINSAINHFQRYKMFMIVQKNKIPDHITLKNQSNLTQEVTQILQIIYNQDLSSFDAQDQLLSQTPQLITFKIGDIMRCKCTSKQSEIIALYRQVEKMSYQKPKELKIIRVKNKLDQGNKDILMNLLFKDSVMVQMQLAIKSEKSKFIDNSNKFNHYFYQMKRAEFGAIMEMCSIWMSQDQRAGFYSEKLQYSNIRKIQNNQQNQKLVNSRSSKRKQCCFQEQNHIIQRLPFKCSECECYYFDCSFYQKHICCAYCKTHTCFRCRFQTSDQCEKVQLVPAINLKDPQHYSSLQQQQIQPLTQIKDNIPEDGGAVIDLKTKSQEQRAIKFKTIYYEKNYYLFERIKEASEGQPTIKLIQKLGQKLKIKQKMIQSAIYCKLDPDDIPNITVEETQKYYFIPKYLKDCERAKKKSMVLIDKTLNEQSFLQVIAQAINIQDWEKFKQNPAQNPVVWSCVQRINLSENQFTNIDLVLMKFPKVELALLSNNRIKDIDSDKLKIWSNLKQLYLARNDIKDCSFITNLLSLEQLDLSTNNIKSLPQKISLLQSLKKLDLSSNDLSNIPKGIGALGKLQDLNLNKNNNILVLPEQFCELKSLKVLNLGCSLQSLPKNISKFEQLRFLNLSENNLTNVPQSIQNFIALKTLSIKNNKIKTFPNFILTIPTLQYVSVSGNKDIKMPTKISQIKNKIKKLQLANLNLQVIPQFISKFKAIESLDLKKNQIKEIPKWIGNLDQSLNLLDLSENKIKKYPSVQFQRLNNLIVLNLSNNQLKEIPQQLEKLISLNILNVSQNKLVSLPKSIQKIEYLTNLSAHSNQLTQFPLIANLNFLRVLNLSNNKIEKISADINKCQQLLNLNLSHNFITEFPICLCQAQALQILNLQDNDISSIPQAVQSLQNLKTLNLSNNSLKTLPNNLCQLKQLATLDLTSNKHLTKLPSSIGQLQNLKVLKLTNTSLTELPQSLAELNQIKVLTVSNLDRSFKQNIRLPKKFGELSSLQDLEVHVYKLSSNYLDIEKMLDLKSLRITYVEETKDSKISSICSDRKIKYIYEKQKELSDN